MEAYDAKMDRAAEAQLMADKPFSGDLERHCPHGTPDDTGCRECFDETALEAARRGHYFVEEA